MDKGSSWNIGQPKYFPGESLQGILRISATNYFWVGEALRENVRADL